MAQTLKTVPGAYGMAILGLVLGIIGMQRFYVRRYLSATLQTLIFLGGLFVFIWEIVQHYYNLLNQLTASLGAGATLNTIPEITGGTVGDIDLVVGYALVGIGGAWWVVDLFLIPFMVKEFNRAE